MEEPSEHSGVTTETRDVVLPGHTEVRGERTVDWSAAFPKGTRASWEFGPFVPALLG